MIRALSVMLMAAAIALSGLTRCQGLRAEQKLLEGYAAALERLMQCIRYERMPLGAALRTAGQDAPDEVRAYFAALRQVLGQFPLGRPPVPPRALQAHPLPIAALCSGMDLEGQLSALRRCLEQVQRSCLRGENQLEQRCRTALSVALAISAMCAVVLL